MHLGFENRAKSGTWKAPAAASAKTTQLHEK
jgi:hypothetical protein